MIKKDQIKAIFDILYPDLQVEIKKIEENPSYRLNENDTWEEHEISLFVGIKVKKFPIDCSEMSKRISNFTSFDFTVYRF